MLCCEIGKQEAEAGSGTSPDTIYDCVCYVTRFTYMIPMITVSHIAMTASSFLMVAASFERYCVTVHPHVTKFLNRN
ncbi:hypothetical protein TELCIR_10781, partial [Teladorsagia circumcincta]